MRSCIDARERADHRGVDCAVGLDDEPDIPVGDGREELDPRAGLALLRRRRGPLQNGLEGLRARGTHEQREHESGECGGTAHERRFGRRPAPHEWGSPPGGPGPVGPPQLLARLESDTLRDEVTQREGDLV